MPTYFQRPENALKRANEFIKVGEKEPALDVLYDVIKSKKHRTWQNKIHEPILFKYLELCVDLRRSHVAKEGLYQYKLICQQVNIASLEEVIRYFLKLAEERAENARQQAREQVMEEVIDLDEIQTPESVLLSFVSGEDTQDRTDRVMLTPWVKFLWEAYRNTLELLRNNARVERLYHETAQQAFKFCLKYTRRTEFRKLCDNLRNHLMNAMKHQGQPNAINLNNPETSQFHLETRLAQLESAISMELWQEAFKAVEDVYGLMQLSKKSPKPQVMANYYQKVTLCFWKANNYLFHAAALHRLFILSREQKKTITPEEVQKMSTRVLLATLAIPISVALSETEKFMELDEIARDKAKRLSNLLNLQTIPTRASLLKDLAKMNVLQHVMPQVKELYDCLEEDFAPLQLCCKVNKVFEFLNENSENELNIYCKPLEDIAIMRLLKQMSQVYQSIEFSRLLSLVPFATEFRLERALVDIAKRNNLQVRIDHRTKSVSFGTDLHVAHKEEVPEGPHLQSMPSERLRNQLTMMSLALDKAILTIQPDVVKSSQAEQRQQLVQVYLKVARKEHKQMLERKAVIEARKEYLESLFAERERKEQNLLKQQQEESIKAERQRLDEERKKREVQRRKQELQEIEKKQAMDKIAALKKTTVGAKALKDLTPEEIDAMGADDIIQRQVEELEKEKRELQIRLKTQEKRVDHLARAKRMVEIPLLKTKYEEHLVEDRKFWEQQEEERIAKAIADRKVLEETSCRLKRMVADKDSFLGSLKDSRNESHDAKLAAFQEHLEAVRKERLEERRRKRYQERKEKARIEKEEARARALEEKRRREQEEEERKAREEKEAREKEYREKMAKLDELERKKKEKEKEIEAKLSRKEQEPARPGPGWKGGPGGETGGRWRETDSRDRDERRDRPPGDREPAADGSRPWRPSRASEEPGPWKPSWSRDERGRDSGQGGGGGSWRRDERDGRDVRDRDRDRDPGPWKRDRDAERERPVGDDRGGPWRRDDRERGFGDRDRGDRGFGDRDRGDRGYGDRDRDRGYGDRERGFDRDRGFGDRDRRGFGDRDRGGGFGDRDRDRGGFGDRDRDRDRDRGGFGDRDRDRGGFGERDRGGFGDRDRDRGGFSDRDRDRGGFGDRDRDRGGFSDRDRERDRDRGGFGDRDRDRGDRDRGGFSDRDRDRDRGGFGDRDRGGGFGDRDRGGFGDRDRGGGGAWRGREDRDRGPPPSAWRDREREGDRDEREGGSSWRDRTNERGPPPPRSEGKSWSASRRGRDRPSDEADPEGWTTVQYNK